MSKGELTVGKIGAPYGVKGWVRIISSTSPREAIFDYSQWSLLLSNKPVSVKVLAWSRSGKHLVAQLDCISDRNVAAEHTHARIQVSKAESPELEKDEFYWHELEGLPVNSSSGCRLGVVDHFLETGANDVMVVRPDSASIDEQERLIPYTDDVILAVESGQKIVVDWEPDY